MVELTNSDELRSWLKHQSREVVVSTTVRAALRVAPLIYSGFDRGYGDSDSLTLKAFRSFATSWASVAGIARAEAVVATANATTDAAVANVYIADSAAEVVLNAARETALCASSDNDYDCIEHSKCAFDTVLKINSFDSVDISALVWMLCRDANAIEQGLPSQVLAQRPLNQHISGDASAIEAFRSSLMLLPARWRELKSVLLKRDKNWRIWTDWYDDRLSGNEQNRFFEQAVLALPQSEWLREPAVVNARLKELMDASRSRFLLQAAMGVSRSDFKEDKLEVLPASDRLVSVRHNQEPFDVLERSLDQIRDEFARDHNKQEYLKLERPELLNIIEEIQEQIKGGWVRLSDLRDRLRPELRKLKEDCEALGVIGLTLLGFAAAAYGALVHILKLVG